MKQTQVERVKEWMQTHGSITTFEAFNELNITRLASRICDLEKAGIRIDRETVYKENAQGDKIYFTRYSLGKEGE